MSNLIMSRSTKLCILLILLPLTILTSHAQPSCTKYTFAQDKLGANSSASTYKTCVDLPELNSFLHYNYYPSNATLEIAYRHTSVTPSKWVAWAINPVTTTMIGSQCLVAYRKPDGSITAYTSSITSYQTEIKEGKLSFDVTGLKAVSHNDEIVIFATIQVPGNKTVLNQVWQDGPLTTDGTPMTHPTSGANIQSMASLNLLSGVSVVVKGASPSFSARNIHGLLNGVSWGILMPTGAIIARYMRVFPSADPAWFYLHVSCQMSAYAVGVAGVATGLKLGNQSPGVEYTSHRNIGITLLVFGSLQMIALLIRPKKDNKYRIYWNIYHHSVGYSTIILSIVNIFKGFGILNPAQKWKNAYIGVIVALAGVAAILEAFTWYVVFRRKRSEVKGHSQKSRPVFDGSYS